MFGSVRYCLVLSGIVRYCSVLFGIVEELYQVCALLEVFFNTAARPLVVVVTAISVKTTIILLYARVGSET